MPFSFRPDPETEALIRRVAARTGWSKSQVVREAVAQYGRTEQPEIQRRRADPGTALADAIRANLASVGVWGDDDRLCGAKPQYPKSQRRREVVTGTGDCSWSNTPMRVLAFVGDQLGDFPAATEMIPGTGSDATFGTTCFLLPNPMYGEWVSRVTRTR